MIFAPPYKNSTEGFFIRIVFLDSRCIGLNSSSESRKEINLLPDDHIPSFCDMASPEFVVSYITSIIIEFSLTP
jgi:hypothetical protein